jgi:hypothetical protein
LLQKGNPDLRFDEAWSVTLLAHPELRQAEEVPQVVTLKLPALKSLGQLSERESVLVVDTREQDPREFRACRRSAARWQAATILWLAWRIFSAWSAKPSPTW